MQFRAVPRFAVLQGFRDSGEAKLRAVDNFSWSARPEGSKKKRKRSEIKERSVNGHFTPAYPIVHDHLDNLMEAMRFHQHLFGEVLVGFVVPAAREAASWSFNCRYRDYGRQTSMPLSGGYPSEIVRNGLQVRFPRYGRSSLLVVCIRDRGIAYLYKGKPMLAFHHGMPFGAASSGEAWDEVGSLIQEAAQKLLHMPLFRYVDDYFSCERRH